MSENPRLPSFSEKARDEGRVILRVAKELRQLLADAPLDDPDVQSLLEDCKTMEKVGQRLSTSTFVSLGGGIPTAGD